MKGTEFVEQYNFSIDTGEFGPFLLQKITHEFMDFWVGSFGKPKKETDMDDYTEKMMFALSGWLSANKRNEEVEKPKVPYLELQKEFMKENDDLTPEAEKALGLFTSKLLNIA